MKENDHLEDVEEGEIEGEVAELPPAQLWVGNQAHRHDQHPAKRAKPNGASHIFFGDEDESYASYSGAQAALYAHAATSAFIHPHLFPQQQPHQQKSKKQLKKEQKKLQKSGKKQQDQQPAAAPAQEGPTGYYNIYGENVSCGAPLPIPWMQEPEMVFMCLQNCVHL